MLTREETEFYLRGWTSARLEKTKAGKLDIWRLGIPNQRYLDVEPRAGHALVRVRSIELVQAESDGIRKVYRWVG